MYTLLWDTRNRSPTQFQTPTQICYHNQITPSVPKYRHSFDKKCVPKYTPLFILLDTFIASFPNKPLINKPLSVLEYEKLRLTISSYTKRILGKSIRKIYINRTTSFS